MTAKPIPLAAVAHAINASKRFAESKAAAAAAASGPGWFSNLFSSTKEERCKPDASGVAARGFFSKIAEVLAKLKAIFQEAFERIKNTQSTDAEVKKKALEVVLKGVFALFSALLLVCTVAVTIWIYAKYAKQSLGDRG